MFKIKRMYSCIRLSNCRHSRLRLYALFTGIAVFFTAVTIFLKVTSNSNSYDDYNIEHPITLQQFTLNPLDENLLDETIDDHSTEIPVISRQYISKDIPVVKRTYVHTTGSSIVMRRFTPKYNSILKATDDRTTGFPIIVRRFTPKDEHVLKTTDDDTIGPAIAMKHFLPKNISTVKITDDYKIGTKIRMRQFIPKNIPVVNKTTDDSIIGSQIKFRNFILKNNSIVHAQHPNVNKILFHTVSKHIVPHTRTYRNYIGQTPHIVWNTNLQYTDRILEQLEYVPKNQDLSKPVTILVFEKNGGEVILMGNEQFEHDKCRVRNCFITDNVEDRTRHVNAVVTSAFHYTRIPFFQDRTNDDVWVFYDIESPRSMTIGEKVRGFNWTSTYRHDSTIVAPYEKWVPYENGTSVEDFPETELYDREDNKTKDYSKGKSKMAAALISNCGAVERMNVIRALSRHIQVDVYGACGVLCQGDCHQIIRKNYKFYLAFENANCADYITEKLFKNALGNDVVPVVFGAPPPDYLRSAPRYSYIHIDNFPSLHHLAKYLKDLNENKNLYNGYFKWKGTGSFINTKFWCRLCAMLNDLDKPQLMVPDLGDWLTTKKCRESIEPLSWNGPLAQNYLYRMQNRVDHYSATGLL